MTTHNIQIRKGFRWLRALSGVALFALAACTEMMQPAAPTQPAKAYVGLFKDNAQFPPDRMVWSLRATDVRFT